MVNLSKIAILFFSIILLSCVNVLAEQVNPDIINSEFAKMDTNKDGFVTSGEMQAYQFKTFTELDKNKNLNLDSKELASDQTKIHQKADKNGDGKVDIFESGSQFNEYFKQLDKNQDKKVSEVEYTDYWKIINKF